MYRASLEEMKYFQNELTNLEAQSTALESVIITHDQEALREVIKFLTRTERNFILSKGQSTVELEKARIESGMVRDLLGVMTNNHLGNRIPRGRRNNTPK
jgi:hypothetical protein